MRRLSAVLAGAALPSSRLRISLIERSIIFIDTEGSDLRGGSTFAGLEAAAWSDAPDGQLFDRQLFYFTTPGASNNPALVPVAINEWLASNTGGLTNPATGHSDDWFEL